MRHWDAINYLMENEVITMDDLSRAWQMPVDVILMKMENQEKIPMRYIHNLVYRFRVNPLFIEYGEKPIVIPKEGNND